MFFTNLISLQPLFLHTHTLSSVYLSSLCKSSCLFVRLSSVFLEVMEAAQSFKNFHSPISSGIISNILFSSVLTISSSVSHLLQGTSDELFSVPPALASFSFQEWLYFCLELSVGAGPDSGSLCFIFNFWFLRGLWNLRMLRERSLLCLDQEFNVSYPCRTCGLVESWLACARLSS